GMARLLRGDMARGEEDIERARSLETAERGLFATDRDRAYGWLAMARGGIDDSAAILLRAAEGARGRGAHALEAMVLHDIVRFGGADRVVDRLVELGELIDGPLIHARIAQAVGVANAGADQLADAVERYEQLGSPLFASESGAQLAVLHDAAGRTAEALAVAERVEAIRARADSPITTPALAALDAFLRRVGAG
ncbi:MAG TPA: hypothetical protein VGK49_06510, partial [Ilumatobacteraceae bacterium]